MSYFGTPRDAGKRIVFKDNSRLMPPTFDPFSEEAYAASDEAEDMILARRKNNQEEPRRYVPPIDAEAKLFLRQQKEFDESIARDKDEMAAGSESDDADDDDDYVLLDQDAPLANESLVLDDEYPEPVEDIQGDSDLLMGSTIQGNLVDTVEQRLAERLRINDSPRESTTDEESLSSAEAEPTPASSRRRRLLRRKVASSAEAEPTPVNDEAMAKWRETLTADFKKIMGSSYDPNSSMDREKMTVLADFKRENPNLSTNALALKIYRSGVL